MRSPFSGTAARRAACQSDIVFLNCDSPWIKRFAGAYHGSGESRWFQLNSGHPQQLGLKLESAKARVDVVVIDHVSRPTDN
jgi:hypothetical protein